MSAMAKMASHFGRNPVSGGNPPNDSNIIGIIVVIISEHEGEAASLVDEIFSLFASRNRGVTTSEYIAKYIIVRFGILIAVRANIHPMCPIEE